MRKTCALASFLFALGVAAPALAQSSFVSPFGKPPPEAPPETIEGIVVHITGGRVAVQMANGKVRQFSAKPGTVKLGQRINAQARPVGDTQRLDSVVVAK